MAISYPAIFFEYPDGRFSVVFPDLNHLATCGDDFDDAMRMAVDCLALYVECVEEDGEPLPPPTPLEKVDPHCEDDDDDPEFASLSVHMVTVDAEEYCRTHPGRPAEEWDDDDDDDPAGDYDIPIKTVKCIMKQAGIPWDGQ